MRIDVLDRSGVRVLARGVVCSLCNAVRPPSRCDVVDFGVGEGVVVCDHCLPRDEESNYSHDDALPNERYYLPAGV